MADARLKPVADEGDWVTIAAPGGSDWKTVGASALNMDLPGSTPRLRQAVGAPEPPPEKGFLRQFAERLAPSPQDAMLMSTFPAIGMAKQAIGGLQAQADEMQHGAIPAAGAVPIIGPLAGQMGRDIGERNYGGATANALQLGATALGAAKGIAAAPEAYSAAKIARTIKAPVEAWNHAVKPVDATATPKNLTIAGPYLKQTEQMMGQGPVTNAAMPTEGLSNLIDFTKSDIGQQTANAIAPHAGVQMNVPGYGQMSIAQAESRIQTLNAQLSKYYKGDPEAQAAMAKIKGGVDAAKSEADALRNAEYDKLNQLGFPDAPRMKKVYGALRGLEDDIEKAHNRALVNSTGGGGIGLFSEVAGKVAKTAKGAAAASGGNPIIAGPLEAVGKLYDWQRNFGSPEYVLHRAWENYDPQPPTPFVTQGPMQGPMSRLLGPGPTQMGAANLGMPGNTGQPVPPVEATGGIGRNRPPQLPPPAPGQPPMNPAATQNVQRPSIDITGQGMTLRQSNVPFTDVGPVRTPQGTLPVHQRFLDAFETLTDKDLRKGFGNLGVTRARMLDEWLRQNNMAEKFPRLTDALDKWLTDLTPDTGVGRKGEMMQ